MGGFDGDDGGAKDALPQGIWRRDGCYLASATMASGISTTKKCNTLEEAVAAQAALKASCDDTVQAFIAIP